MPTTETCETSVKAAAARIVQELPESASWEDVMYHLYVRQKIDNGLSDLQAGRVHSHADVLQEFGLAR